MTVQMIKFSTVLWGFGSSSNCCPVILVLFLCLPSFALQLCYLCLCAHYLHLVCNNYYCWCPCVLPVRPLSPTYQISFAYVCISHIFNCHLYMRQASISPHQVYYCSAMSEMLWSFPLMFAISNMRLNIFNLFLYE